MENQVHIARHSAQTVSKTYRCVPRKSLQELKLLGKPRCAWCETPLVFLYGDIKCGSISVRCSNCRKTTMIDFANRECLRIIAK